MAPKPRILVADDEAHNRSLMEALLAPQGYEVLFARDGAEAVALAAEASPDVILLDVMMPRMDGYEVCRAIRSDPELAGVFVMILTARGQKSDEAKALEVGADLYMSKPFDDEIVLQVIQDVFEGRLVSHHGASDDGPVVHYSRSSAAAGA